MPSILVDSQADMLLYGMSERQLIEIATRLKNGEKPSDITDVRGIAYLTEPINTPIGAAECPSFEQVVKSKEAYAKATRINMISKTKYTEKPSYSGMATKCWCKHRPLIL